MEVAPGIRQENDNIDRDARSFDDEDITEGEEVSPSRSTREEFKEININDSKQHSDEEEVVEQDPPISNNDNIRPNSVMSPDGLNVTLNNKKLGSFKEWSKSRLTYTKQLLSESFGYGTKTVDGEIEKQIHFLNESKLLCTSLIAKAKAVLTHMTAMNSAQKDLGQFLCEHSLKDLSTYKGEMMCNGEMYHDLHKHTDSYEGVLRMFISNLSTLNDKTLDDSLLSVKNYEACRVEYDAYRVEYEEAQKTSNETRVREARSKYEVHLGKFNQNRSDLLVKIKLFEENKEKVIKRNLNVLQDTLARYSRDCSTSLSQTASHYDFKPITTHSWLENTD